MNKEYMILSDDSIAVTNENGNIRKKDFADKHFIAETLMLENKIEILNDKLEKLNNDLKDCKGVQFLCKKLRNFQPILISLAILCGFVFGGIFSTGDFVLAGVYYGSLGLVYSAIIGVSASIYATVVDSKNSKKIIGLESSIEEANILKYKYDKDLSIIKQIRVTESKIGHQINTPISLEEQNKNIYERIETELDNAYEEAINSKTKQKILRKNKKHN